MYVSIEGLQYISSERSGVLLTQFFANPDIMWLMSRKIILNACITGMVPTRELTPYVPLTPEEIAIVADNVIKLGVSVLHIHPRDEDGKPTWRKDIYKDIIGRIRKKHKDVVISVSTSGRLWSDFERRSECLELDGKYKPDLASLTTGSLNFISSASMNDPEMIKKLAQKMMERGIKPEIEAFEPGMVEMAKYLMKKGIVNSTSPYFNLFLGSLGTAPLSAAMMAAYLSVLPQGAVWSVGGVGQYQLDANLMALAMGGNVRVGIEDNLFFDRDKKILASNEMLVSRLAKMITDMELSIATPNDARDILGLPAT